MKDKVQNFLQINSFKTVAVLAVTAMMLTFMQAPYDMWLLAFVCYIPFTLAILKHQGGKRLYFIAYFVQVVFWLINIHWFALVTVPGWIAASFFCGIYWPFIVFVLRKLYAYKVPLIIALPFAIVGAEAWQGIFFEGFDWFFLGHSQYLNLRFIQIADIFGVSGISFLIAMINGLFCDWLLNSGKSRVKINVVSSFIVIVLLGLNFSYGGHCLDRISNAKLPTTSLPLIASVQSNVMPEIKESSDQSITILQNVINISNQASECNPDLVIWPETMVMGAINVEFLSYLSPEKNELKLHSMIVEHCKGRFPVVVGAHRYSLSNRDGGVYVDKPYNSAYLYHRNGLQDSKIFDKIHLVPFGEYIPYKDSIPGLNKLLKIFTPYDYDYSIGSGQEYTRFEFRDRLDRNWKYAVMICYEDTDADVVRKLSYNAKHGKVDFIVNISNDGWYITVDCEKYNPSNELPQRTAITVFRAIENRISIIRSVNTGISCMILPDGTIRDGYEYGSLPLKTFERQAVEGWFADRPQICSDITLFTQYGKWLDKIIAVLIFTFICCSIIQNKIQARRIVDVSK